MAKRRSPKKAEARPGPLRLLDTGVPGLNDVLGGGLPEFSFNVIAGSPGSGKTTLAMQLLFANATPARPALFVTLLGETSLKLLRYQQLFGFFDAKLVGKSVRFLNLSDEALGHDLEAIMQRISEEVRQHRPALVVVDSFRSLTRARGPQVSTEPMEQFVQQLAHQLTTWHVTSFLIGEYTQDEMREPVFTVADGVLWLSQEVSRNSVVRRLQVIKARGMNTMPGLHTVRMTEAGVQVFPRAPELPGTVTDRNQPRLSTGIPDLDTMMGGGIPAGDSLVLAGPTGTGKTTFAMQFVAAGLRNGESAVIAIFEEHPERYLERARRLEPELRSALAQNTLRIIYLRPLDLSVDETLDEIRSAVKAIGATRVVIDSISGFEMALAPAFREDFRESLYRLIGTLTRLGVTIYSTVEVIEGQGSVGLQFTGYRVSFLTDDVISQRYVEVEGELRKALVVVKMRGSAHSRDYCGYEITATGVQIRQTLHEYDNISTGMPARQLREARPDYPGLTAREGEALEFIVRYGASTLATIASGTALNSTDAGEVCGRLLSVGYVTREGARYRADVRARGR